MNGRQERLDKFTPGPWRLWRHVNKNCPAASQTAVFGTGNRQFVMIAQTHSDGAAKPEQTVDEIIANASLIAAAPEMYEALAEAADAIVAFASQYTIIHAQTGSFEKLMDAAKKARQIYRKARGEK